MVAVVSKGVVGGNTCQVALADGQVRLGNVQASLPLLAALFETLSLCFFLLYILHQQARAIAVGG